jgi:hypothetical protein
MPPAAEQRVRRKRGGNTVSENYRVHYRKGDVDIEVESTDKAYVNEMLAKLLATSPTLSEKHGARRVQRRQTRSTAHDAAGGKESDQTSVDVPGVVADIHDADNYADIEKHVLNKRAELPRILLVCHFAHEHGHAWLTTGDIEALTDQLGMKISQANASNCISANRKYFTAGTVRKKGTKVPYKINRQGKLTLDEYVAGGKP